MGNIGFIVLVVDIVKEYFVMEKMFDDVFKFVKDEKVEYVDVWFCDLFGIM